MKLYTEINPIKSPWPHAETNHSLISNQVDLSDYEFGKLSSIFEYVGRKTHQIRKVNKNSVLTGHIGYLTHLGTKSKARMFYLEKGNPSLVGYSRYHLIHIYKIKECFVLYENKDNSTGIVSKLYKADTIGILTQLLQDLNFIDTARVRNYKLNKI